MNSELSSQAAALLAGVIFSGCCPTSAPTGSDAGFDAGPCDSSSNSCDCFGEPPCGPGSSCSDVVQGCTEIPPLCDGSGRIVLDERDAFLGEFIAGLGNPNNGTVIAVKCYSQMGRFEFKLVGGDFPAGMTVTTDVFGKIGGVPDATDELGIYHFMIGVHDYGNNTDDASYYSVRVISKDQVGMTFDGG